MPQNLRCGSYKRVYEPYDEFLATGTDDPEALQDVYESTWREE